MADVNPGSGFKFTACATQPAHKASVEGLARIAADPNTDAALRARVYADLLPYLCPRRKSVESSGQDATPTNSE